MIARIYDPIRADRYRQLGIITLCTTTISSGLLRDYIDTGEWGLAKDYSQVIRIKLTRVVSWND